MDPLKRLLPERLASARRHLGLSQNRLAREAAVAVSTVNAIESGLGDFRVSTLLKLCGVLGVSPGWLLGFDEGTRPKGTVIEIGVVRRDFTVEIVITGQIVAMADLGGHAAESSHVDGVAGTNRNIRNSS